MEIRPVEAEFFHANGKTDRQTDMTQLTLVFPSLAKCLKNSPKFYDSMSWLLCEIALHPQQQQQQQQL
jgi:nitrate reductase assembly molybdenum cofactor insertion protein NarJ